MTSIKAFIKTILYTPLFNALIFLIWLVPGDNVGWAIIILTVIIRFILYPSYKKSIVAQREMQRIQPELEKIKEKHKDNQQAQTQATMALYKQYKINPLSSCLPLLIQLPIIWVLYKVFMDGITTDHFNLLYSFTPRPETLNNIFYTIDLSTPNLYLAILAGILQFFQSKQIMGRNENKKQTKKKSQMEQLMGSFSTQMIYIFPIFTVIIAMKLPSALALYWVVTTLFMIIQQWLVFKNNKKDPTGVSVKIRD